MHRRARRGRAGSAGSRSRPRPRARRRARRGRRRGRRCSCGGRPTGSPAGGRRSRLRRAPGGVRSRVRGNGRACPPTPSGHRRVAAASPSRTTTPERASSASRSRTTGAHVQSRHDLEDRAVGRDGDLERRRGRRHRVDRRGRCPRRGPRRAPDPPRRGAPAAGGTTVARDDADARGRWMTVGRLDADPDEPVARGGERRRTRDPPTSVARAGAIATARRSSPISRTASVAAATSRISRAGFASPSAASAGARSAQRSTLTAPQPRTGRDGSGRARGMRRATTPMSTVAGRSAAPRSRNGWRGSQRSGDPVPRNAVTAARTTRRPAPSPSRGSSSRSTRGLARPSAPRTSIACSQSMRSSVPLGTLSVTPVCAPPHAPGRTVRGPACPGGAIRPGPRRSCGPRQSIGSSARCGTARNAMLPQPMMPSLTSKRRRRVVATVDPSARRIRASASGSPTGNTQPTGVPAGRLPSASRHASQKARRTTWVASIPDRSRRIGLSTRIQRRPDGSPGGWNGRPRETSGPRGKRASACA